MAGEAGATAPPDHRVTRFPGFWPYIVMALLGVAGILMTTMPARGEGAPPCIEPEMIAGYLRDRGFTLDAWGLDNGDMEELWLGPGGWAVVRTTPLHCARIVSMPTVPNGRLAPPLGNPRMQRPLERGTAS
jgi:hypothetical protein